MKRIICLLVLMLLPTLSFAEESKDAISKLPYRPLKVYKIQTALGFVTTLDLGEEVEKVYLGDSDYFQVEVYGNQVILKPTMDAKDLETNLTVFTKSHRLSFSVAVGPAHSADLVLEFKEPYTSVFVDNAFKKKVEAEAGTIKAEFEEKSKELQAKHEKELKEKEKESISKLKSKVLKDTISKDGIRFSLSAVCQLGDKSFLKFTITNTTNQPFLISQSILGVKEKGKAMREIPSELNIAGEVPSLGAVSGALVFDKSKGILSKDEKAFVRLIEKDGKGRVLEISGLSLEV